MMSDSARENSSQPSDRTLLRRVRSGEADAATDLYLRYASRLQRLVQGQTSPALARQAGSEDIVQSIFRTFFRRASDGLYEVADSEELWKLFLVISLNKIRKLAEYHGAAKRDQARTVSGKEYDFAAESVSESDNAAALQTLKLTIDEVLSTLPPEHVEVVQLRIEGHTLPEILEQTGRALRTIERMLKNFREQLLQLTGAEP
ncbi:MAG: RNA polymerase sigma factor [Planctomycetota bacterium]